MMLSSLCRQFSTACTVRTLASSAASSPEVVQVLKLNMLQDNPGAVKKVCVSSFLATSVNPVVRGSLFSQHWIYCNDQQRRIGRGIGSSKGKTSGRGHKGQKARSGGSIPLAFEGGQTKFYKLVPKRGFKNKPHQTEMLSVNVGTIQDFIDMGRLPQVDEGKLLTMKDLVTAGIATTSSIKHGMKLLAKGKERLTTPIQIQVSRASEDAIEAIETVGGEVTTVHYNRLALRALLKPHKFEHGIPKFARPPPKWQPYYTNWHRHRGYLSVQAQMRELLRNRPELQDPFADALEASRQKHEVESPVTEDESSKK